MIMIITTNSINLKDHIKLKNTKKVKSIGELDLAISNCITLKDEVLNFKVKESKIELLVGLNWIKNTYDISSIIFFDYIAPVNKNLLSNHLVIPKMIYSIDDPPLEWGNDPLINKIEINSSQNNRIRKAIYETNYDFIYGDILSIDNNLINDSAIEELRNLNDFDGLNQLIFSSNKFANKNNIDIYNLVAVKTNSMTNLKYKKLFEKLF